MAPMPLNLALLEQPGPCPLCGRTVPSLEAVLHNVQASYVAVHTTYVGRDRTGLHLASATLNSTATALRCLLGSCRASGT